MKFIHFRVAAYRCYSTYRSTSRSTQSYAASRNKPGDNDSGIIIKWTNEQKSILEAVSEGHSVFITGSAGTGKTLLVNHIVTRLNDIHPKGTVFVTASTGAAACAVNGQTVHSFAGIGFGLVNGMTPEMLVKQVMDNKKAFTRWCSVKSLVVDEISMIPHHLFECLELIARKIKSRGKFSEERIWGGIQLVVSGDFFQLPPVMDCVEDDTKVFAFEADCWHQSFHLQVELTKIFRQTDPQFVKLLQGIRKGSVDSEGLGILERVCLRSDPDSAVVQLFPHANDVKRVNKIKLESLKCDIIAYNALDTDHGGHWKWLLDKGIALERLELCVGARVMLIKNLNILQKLVNGATGTITGFKSKDKSDKDIHSICEGGNYLPVVKFDSGPEVVISPETWQGMVGDKIVAQRKQIPLILAWAMSIHKCQGMTLDSLHTDLRHTFGPAMVYVALSRVKSLAGLHLSGFDPEKIRAHPKVVQFYETFFL